MVVLEGVEKVSVERLVKRHNHPISSTSKLFLNNKSKHNLDIFFSAFLPFVKSGIKKYSGRMNNNHVQGKLLNNISSFLIEMFTSNLLEIRIRKYSGLSFLIE